MSQNNGIRIPISEWFARHTVRPLLVTSALFFFAMTIMLAFIVSGGRTQSEDSATHLIRMAELATLQKNRSLIESLADLGHKDIGLQALIICDGERPLFLYPDNRTDCNLKPFFLQRIITHSIPGMDDTIIAMVIPKFPGYHLALFGAAITALFIFTSLVTYRRIGNKIENEILKPILSGVQDEKQISMIRMGLKITELDRIFAAYQKKIVDLRMMGKENAKNAEEAAISRMTHSLAHDLKNPLAMFEFAMNANSIDEFNKSKSDMGRAFERIHAIISSIRNRKSGEVVNPQPSHLGLDNIASQFNLIHGQNGVEVATKDGTSTYDLFIDKVAIERSLFNLLSNAIEAGATSIEIRSEIEDSTLSLRVKDNGPGIPAVIIPQLFQRGATHGKLHGQGIGLFNVKQLVEAHGGSVDYFREENCSTFRLILPNALAMEPALLAGLEPDLPQTRDLSPVESPRKIGLPRILVVINNQERSNAIVAALANIDAEIHTDLTPTEQPTLVYTDSLDKTGHFASRGIMLLLDSSSTTIADVVKKLRQIIATHYRAQQKKESI